jgi:predicted permease
VLALAGGGVGLVFAGWAHNALWAWRPPLLSTAGFHIELDGRVLAFTLGVSLLTGILFGLTPALRSTRPDLATCLKERSGQPASGVGGRRTRSVLVTLEIALCVISLVGAGLFVRSLRNAQHMNTGFDAERLAMVSFNVAGLGYDPARSREFQIRALERAAAAPGVVSAALAKDTMFRVSMARAMGTEDDPQGAQGRVTLVSPVSQDYFRTTGIALLRGRDFTALDTPKTPRVAVINEAAAARYWPNQNAIGRRLRLFGDEVPLEVIGIARNANYHAVGEPPQALVYTDLLQESGTSCAIIIRAGGDPQTTLTGVLREVQALEPHLLLQPATVSSVLLNSLWAPRLSAGLLSVFGMLGLVLASVGIYGVISYSVNQRTREIGIRMALGASPADVQTMMLIEVLKLIALGVSAGVLGAMAGAQTIRSLLFVSGPDIATFVLVPALLVLVALLASWVPVVRATHIDPATALRQE